jgi:hypothetical protein
MSRPIVLFAAMQSGNSAHTNNIAGMDHTSTKSWVRLERGRSHNLDRLLRAVAGFRFQIFVDLPQRRLSMVAEPRRRRPPRFRVENALEHGRIAFPPGRKDPLPPLRQEVNRDVKARLEGTWT